MAQDSSRSSRIPSEERLFSLVLALVASPQGVTRAELLSSVYGYAHRAGDAKAQSAVERQFERDKELIRELGIPLETIDSPLEPGNNQLTRYRIAKDRLQLPEDIRFSDDELTALRLAAYAWGEGSLQAESRWVTMKLASLGASVDVRHIGVAPRLTLTESSAPALQRAIEARRVVTFEYRLPGRSASLPRNVAPLRLHQADGRWHLIAHDLDRDASRVFLLQRITSAVRVRSEPFSEELFAGVPAVLEELEAMLVSQPARVLVEPGSIAHARFALRARTESHTAHDSNQETPHETSQAQELTGEFSLISLWLRTLDYYALADEIVGFAGEAIASEPKLLRDQVRSVLQEIRTQHADEMPEQEVSA